MKAGIISFLFMSISAQETIQTSAYKISAGVLAGGNAAGV
jgi:hypothetical protein